MSGAPKTTPSLYLGTLTINFQIFSNLILNEALLWISTKINCSLAQNYLCILIPTHCMASDNFYATFLALTIHKCIVKWVISLNEICCSFYRPNLGIAMSQSVNVIQTIQRFSLTAVQLDSGICSIPPTCKAIK